MTGFLGGFPQAETERQTVSYAGRDGGQLGMGGERIMSSSPAWNIWQGSLLELEAGEIDQSVNAGHRSTPPEPT